MHQVQLLRPDRVRTGDDHRTVAFRHWPRCGRHPLSNYLGPDALQSGEGRFGGGALEGSTKPLRGAAWDATSAHAAAEWVAGNGSCRRQSSAREGTDSAAAAVINA